MSMILNKLKQMRLLQFLDFAGWFAVSFVVMYCSIFIFQNYYRFNEEGLVSLQPLLTKSSLRWFLYGLLLFAVVYIKLILPFLMKCRIPLFFILTLLFPVLVGGFFICHFSIEPVSDFKTLASLASQWQALSQADLERIMSQPGIAGFFSCRCYFSYYMLYKIFGCRYVVIEISQLFMHLFLGVNVYFLAKQCTLQDRIARLSMILYFFMPIQYFYLTIPSLDIWGGALLCFNVNLVVYLFRQCQRIQFYKHADPIIPPLPVSKKSGINCFCYVRYLWILLGSISNLFPWLLPLLVSVLLGITIFWMEKVRNIQLLLCVPMFFFLLSVTIRRILTGRIKLFSRTILFLCTFCLIIPFLSGRSMQKILNSPPPAGTGIPVVTAMFNAPNETREVVGFSGFQLLPPECRKDFALDAATSFWNLYPRDYARFLAVKIGHLSNLFETWFIETPQNTKKYPMEFVAYRFLIWFVKLFFWPLLLFGILSILFHKRWDNFMFVPIVLFFFFFFSMPTVGESQVRYTSLVYAPMCICAACSFAFIPMGIPVCERKKKLPRFLSSILLGICSIIILLVAVTSLFSNPAFSEKHQLINFSKNLRSVSSGEGSVAYERYTEKKYALSSVFHPVVSGAIPEKTFVEWTIPHKTEEGREYALYGYLIAPPPNMADLVIKINNIPVWDNAAKNCPSVSYTNPHTKIFSERIFFLSNLKFSAEKENILCLEITPKSKTNVSFALSAWGMVSAK